MKKRSIKPFTKLLIAGVLSVSAVAAAGVVVLPVAGVALEDVQAATNYTLDASLVAGSPGVYKTKARLGDEKGTATIGIPSVAKQNLNGGPTTEGPAIIMGAAVNYEKRTGATEFTPIPGAELTAPYSYFRWGVMDEQIKDADGNVTTHRKLTGFDGSYYIIRVDVSDIIKDVENPENKYLHVKQTDNKALMVASGIENLTFSDALGNKTGSYSLANNAAALKDSTGNDTDTPYIDVVVMSSGKLVAGADTGKETAPKSDISLSFYVDDVADYNPDLKYDPTSTDPNHAQAVLNKFFSDEKNIAANNSSSYLVKGSDLEIDVMVDETESNDGVSEFSSLTDALYYQPFDSHTIRLICEVPVLEGIDIQGGEGNKRSVILDVNSFDIQFANHSTTYGASLTVGNNVELTVKDGSHTAGAELAIGNNAFMIVENGGTLIIDETCTVEAEYDAATTVDPAAAPSDLFQGVLLVNNGGKIINRGVFNIEGTEAKPLDPNAQEQKEGQQTQTDMKNSAVYVLEGGEFHNYGALSIKGEFDLFGTLYNYGKYDDVIKSGDPDKGTVTYHRGIQLTWKDDVRKEGVVPGLLSVGLNMKEHDLLVDTGVLDNIGDVVMAPGTIDVYGTINNHDGGKIYINDATEAVVPITPTAQDPMTREQRITLDPPKKSVLNVNEHSTVNTVETDIRAADVAVISNGHLGELIVTGEAKGDVKDIKSTDFVIYAKDMEKNLVQDQDYYLKDGGVVFTHSYTDTFTGERTVTINIGYRYYYVTVKGTKSDYVSGVWAYTVDPTKLLYITPIGDGTYEVKVYVPLSDREGERYEFTGTYDFSLRRLGFDGVKKVNFSIDENGNITETSEEENIGGAFIYKDGVFILHRDGDPDDQELAIFTRLNDRYAITPGETMSGKISVNTESAYPGEFVIIKTEPDEGFAVHNVFVSDKDGKEVELNRIGENVFTFFMPEGDVTASATFVDSGGGETDPTETEDTETSDTTEKPADTDATGDASQDATEAVSSADTGDESRITLWTAVAASAGIATTAAIVAGRKKKTK